MPVNEWAAAIKRRATIGNQTEAQFNRKLEKVMQSLMQKEILGRDGDHIYLTAKGEALK